MTPRPTRLALALGASALIVPALAAGHAGASGDEDGWTVDVEDCPDPEAVAAPIEGTIRIGSAMPLSGPVAAAFEPAARGFEAFINYANENDLVPGYELEVVIQDDQYDPSLTPSAVQSLIDGGVHLFSGNIGTPQNLSVRTTINEECIPHLNLLTGDPVWGEEVEDYPWTTGLLTPYHLENRGYAQHISETDPDATVALYYVNNDFGNVAADAFREAADEFGLDIVAEQTVEATDNAPPQAQLSQLADSAPDVIVATPLGIQCLTFLNELANAKAAAGGWDPAVYLTNTCSAPLILIGAGENADGLITSAAMGIVDIANPENADIEPVAAYLAEMEAQGLGDIVTTGAAGWNAAEVTVAILTQAAADPDGLSQKSIIEAARSLNFHPMLLREGMNYIMNGEEDTYYSEDVQITQYDAAVGHFHDLGDFYSYETSAEE